jgi:transposase
MLNEYDRERIRRAFHLEHKSMYRIAQEEGYSHHTIEKALSDAPPKPHRRTCQRSSPVFGPYQPRVEALLHEGEQMPRKQRYTAHKIFEILREEGYQGSESRVRQYLSERKKAHQAPKVFLPLEFDPGQDAQVDWGEAVAMIAGQRQTIQFFLMRLCYSRRAFAVAFPSQAQECFLSAHVCAFNHFGGVPHRISYDNLGTAVKITLDGTGKRGRPRQEVQAFVSFRSYYLFESHFCTPGLDGAHEKGGVESGIGYTRRQFMVPIPEATSFEDLNRQLLARAFKEDSRRVARQQQTIGEAWEEERASLLPLPPPDYECCAMATVRITPYSQVQFETNRYSVPADRARRTVTLKAYPFHVEIWDGIEKLSSHPRCYEREQDVFNPLHYLPLLEQRPNAFDFAKPIRRWREDWPPSYNVMLRKLREIWPDGRGVRDFIPILQLHQQYPAQLVEQAIEQALSYGCVHLDGVSSCLHQLRSEAAGSGSAQDGNLKPSSHLDLEAASSYPVDLSRYEQLLKLSW